MRIGMKALLGLRHVEGTQELDRLAPCSLLSDAPVQTDGFADLSPDFHDRVQTVLGILKGDSDLRASILPQLQFTEREKVLPAETGPAGDCRPLGQQPQESAASH